jgi:hypothetical protein
MAKLLDALAQVESSGRFGIVGPQTKYGRALGGYQMLSGTAQEMARKEGLRWQAHLMTSPTKEGQDYQRRLANAYLQEGLQRTGNVRDALKYYHGGPNRKLWGPKTDAHAEKVLALAGPDAWEESKPMQSQKSGLAALLQQQPQMMADAQAGLAPQQVEPVGLAALMQQPQTDAEGNPLAVPNMDAMSLGTVNGRDPLAPKPKFFGKGGMGMYLLCGVADGIAQHFGAKPGFGPTVDAMRADEREQNQLLEMNRQKRAERMQPKIMQAGPNIYAVDPETQQVTPLHEGQDAPDPTALQRNIDYLRSLKPDLTNEEAAAIVMQSMSPPRIITYNSGDQTVTEEVGPGGRRPISKAPRWQPKPPAASAAPKLPNGFILD